MRLPRVAFFLAASSLFACSAPPSADLPREHTASVAAAVSGSSIVSIALANVGKGACSTNSQGGAYFDSSCTGNGGQPEYWCADFARWVWEAAGASNMSELTAAAGSFYVFGQNHGTLHSTPSLGDAVVFDYQGGGVANHVAIVTQVNADGTIESVSGDWNGQSGTEAEFASTSSVVVNAPAYGDGVGTAPGVIGMTISGYISPIGLTGGASYGASFVSQSFPYASSAMNMVAGDAVKATITMKNTGTKAWDASTRLATSNPRDRKSAFAGADWLSPSRLAAVSGSVAPGDSYTFAFTFHAPEKAGTYFEYFNLVQEGVAWFSDPGQGGPVDDDLEAQIVVEAAPDAGGGGEKADAGAGAAGSGEDAAAPAVSDDAGGVGSGTTPTGAPSSSPSGTPDDGADAAAAPSAAEAPGGVTTRAGGCAAAPSGGGTGGRAAYAGLAFGLFALGSRRRRARARA